MVGDFMKKLIEIKTLIALMLTFTLVYCIVVNRLPAEFIAIYGSIIGFYYVDKSRGGDKND